MDVGLYRLVRDTHASGVIRAFHQRWDVMSECPRVPLLLRVIHVVGLERVRDPKPVTLLSKYLCIFGARHRIAVRSVAPLIAEQTGRLLR